MRNINVQNATGIDLRDITLTGDLTVNALGNISNNGVITAGGTSRITGNVVTLNNVSNNFNNVALNGTSVSIVDLDSINFSGSSSASNNLTVTAFGGDITDSAAAVITVTNDATLSASGNVILDSGNHNFGTVYVNSGGNVTVSDLTGINLGTTSVAGNLSILAGRNAAVADIINTSGVITVGGTASFISSGGSNVTLNNAANQMAGAISATATGGALNNVVIVNNTITQFDQVNAANDLTVTSSGEITDIDAAAVIVGNQTTLVANGNNVILDGNNDFNSFNATSVNNVTLNDVTGLTLPSLNTTGVITTTSNGLSVGAINASAINLDAGNGAIADLNADATNNLVANTVRLRAATGIGSANAIETVTANLDVINNTSGAVGIFNTGSVTLTNLVNRGDIAFSNVGNVELVNVKALDLRTAPTPSSGSLLLEVTNGSVTGIERGSPELNLSVLDIEAYSAIIAVSDEFGTEDRPIIMYIRTGLLLDAAFSSIGFPIAEPEPFTNRSAIQSNAFDAISAVSGLKLVEVESAAEIDQAIFTAVRNYNYDDISIRMPSDQLYEDEEEDKKQN